MNSSWDFFLLLLIPPVVHRALGLCAITGLETGVQPLSASSDASMVANQCLSSLVAYHNESMIAWPVVVSNLFTILILSSVAHLALEYLPLLPPCTHLASFLLSYWTVWACKRNLLFPTSLSNLGAVLSYLLLLTLLYTSTFSRASWLFSVELIYVTVFPSSTS